jgi:oligoendopeptidase F
MSTSSTTHSSDTSSPYTWDLASIFPTRQEWQVEAHEVLREAERLVSLKGALGRSAEEFCNALRAIDSLIERLGKVRVYASLVFSADTRDDDAIKMTQYVDALSATVGSRLSFVEPEILSIGWPTIEKMCESSPALRVYQHYLSELERRRRHTLAPEQEELLSELSVVTRLPESIRNAAHDGDMRFTPISVGTELRELTHGTIDDALQSVEPATRQAAYTSYTDSYIASARTLAAALTAEVTTSLAFSKARGYSSTFEKALFVDDLTPDVYHAAVRSCREHQHLFRRYFRAKAKILGLSQLGEHDIFAKLSPRAPEIPYERAAELVLASLAPLGDEYVSIARRGLTEERWVHVFPAPGKYSNAFSSGSYLTRPFFLLNYTPTMPEVGTLAHELGHSMHSLFTNRSQPSRYAGYAMTVAETASNLNQVLLRAHVLKSADREMSLAVLDEAFYYAHRYLFMMPLLSRIEHAVHSIYARGGAVGVSDIRKATVTAFGSAYDGAVSFDPERLGMKWGAFCHFYAPYYFFQYAIGISAAMAIGQRILNGEPGIREKYMSFLSAGGSKSPRELFRIVDIDITSPDLYRTSFGVVEGYVRELERLSEAS